MLKAFSPYIFAPNHDFAERKFRAKHQVEETVHIIKVCGNAEDRRPFESSSVRKANFSSAQTVTQTRKGKVKRETQCSLLCREGALQTKKATGLYRLTQ